MDSRSKKVKLVNKLATSRKYNLIQCDTSNIWDELVFDSINPSIICLSSFLKINHENHKKFLIRKRNEVVAGIALLCSDDDKNIVKSNKVIYSPILYKKKIITDRAIGAVNVELYNIITAVYEHIIEHYRCINLTFDYHTNDIRPFVWHNFYNRDEHFTVVQKFTSILNSTADDDDNFFEDKIVKNFIQTKRNEFRQALSSGLSLSQDINIDSISKMMNDTFNNQDIDVNKEYNLESLLKILQKLKEKNLVSFFCTKNSNKDILNFAIIGKINTNAQFLYTGRSFSNSNSHAGTYLHAAVIKELLNLKIKVIDLEGINSPKRAFFKIGFGGKIKPYYNLKLLR